MRHAAHACDLRWEGRNHRTARGVDLALYFLQQLPVELVNQQIELCVKRIQHPALCSLFGERQGEAPNLFALFFGQAIKELAEASDQVSLGEQDIDREMHA